MTHAIQHMIPQFAPVIQDWDVSRRSYFDDDGWRNSVRIFDRKMTVDDVFSKNRNQDIVTMKYCLIWTIKSNFNIGLKRIAKAFGVDHTTILHAFRKVNDMIYIRDDKYLECLRRLNDYKPNVFNTDNHIYLELLKQIETKVVKTI